MKATGRLLPYFVSFLMSLLVIYPAIRGAGWFYLDVPTIVLRGSEIINNLSLLLPDNSGRYVPFFWTYYALLYNFFGSNVSYYFVIQAIIIISTSFVGIMIMKMYTRNIFWICIGLVLFYTSSPLAENAYTLGKHEHLVLLLLFLIILLSISYIKNASNKKIIAIFILTILANWTKETSMALIVFPLSIMLITLITTKLRNKYFLKVTIHVTIAVFLGIAISRVIYYLLDRSETHTYTSYDINLNLIKSNLIYYIKNQPDVFIIGLVSLVLFLIFYKRYASDEKMASFYSIIGGLLLFAWAYILGLLLWRWPFGYYFYIPSSIFSLVFILIISSIERKSKFLLIALYTAIIVSRTYSIAYNYYIAMSQVSMTQLYTKAVNDYVANGKNSKLFVENWTFYEEPTSQTNLLVKKIFGRDDLEVVGLADIYNPTMITPEIRELYQINNIPDQAHRTPKKGDYVLVFSGYKPAYWNLRAVTPVNYNQSKTMEAGVNLELESSEDKTSKTLFSEATSYKIKFGNTHLGYKLYKVLEGGALGLWKGRYEDGWITKHATYSTNVDSNQEKIVLSIHAPKYVLPANLTIKVEEQQSVNYEIKNEGEQIIELDISKYKDKKVNLDFLLDKTFVPKNEHVNNDTRELGVQIEILSK
ncbi:hypothetical protein ACFVVQ_19765 [Paenibacillus chitinolyticus]|uniref:hypothetical protein n=1 Tax=Paenibacillus chitinolyticus TaxID=79263 RepID=UPI0036DEA310